MDERRFRISIKNLLLIVAFVGMAIVIALQWREIGPLRAQVRSMRTELGQLNIDEPSVAQAIRVGTTEADHWRWRIYLPPGRKYGLFTYFGTIPPTNSPDQAWFKSVKKSGRGTYGTCRDGEFLFDVRLVKEDGRWSLVTSNGNGQSTNKISPIGDWLSERYRSINSAVGLEKASAFPNGQPMLLMKMLAPVVTPTGWEEPKGPANGIVVWIEQQSPSNPTSGGSP